MNMYMYVCLNVCMYISLAEFMPYMHVTNSSVHGMNTRQQNKLHILSVRLSSIQRGVCYSSVKMISELPQNIFKYCNNIHTFKTLLRDCLANNAFYSIEEFLSAGDNDVDIRTFIFNFFHYCVFVYDLFFVICHVLINFM